MSDIKLSDGRELTVNLESFTIKEYRDMVSSEQDPDAALLSEDELISRSVGMKLDEYQNLSYKDWKRITRAFFNAVRGPLDDPN